MTLGYSLWHWIIVLIALPVTFLPSIIAFRQNDSRKWLIFCVQFLTFIGWIIALIWATKGDKDQVTNSAKEVLS